MAALRRPSRAGVAASPAAAGPDGVTRSPTGVSSSAHASASATGNPASASSTSMR
jgi:hypothetical protein